MKIQISKQTSLRKSNRLSKKIRIRKSVFGTAEKPRLCVFRSAKHIYLQLINDIENKTISSISSLTFESTKKGKDLAFDIGRDFARISLKSGISTVVFDRNGYLYHGRVQSVADGARDGGLKF